MENSYCSTAERIILDVFSFLEKEGYIAEAKNIDDDSFIDKLQVKFVNDTIKREITVSYTKGIVEKEIRYTFSLSIVRLPFDWAVIDFISMHVYLFSIGKDFDTRMINHFDESEAHVIVEKIAMALKTSLWEVVKGEIWLEGYYPRW